MPTAAFSQNLFYVAVSYMLSLVLTMCQLFPVSLLTKAVVVEKELRLKQTMRIMGLRDAVLYPRGGSRRSCSSRSSPSSARS